MTILDTHIWIWWVSQPSKLSDAAREHIAEAMHIGVSAISPWEVAMLVAKGRLALDRDVLLWIKQALQRPKVELIPISPEIAVTAVNLARSVPGDPADRLIAASALHLRATLVTRDRVLATFPQVQIIR